MTWVLIVWTVVILAWAISGGTSGAKNCASQTGSPFLSAHAAQQACNAGTGIGVAIILVIGFFGFVFLSLIWFMSRPRHRECPACGIDVKRGTTVCGSCGHDFAAAAGTRPVTSA